MAPSISFRKYIRWIPDESSEPTNTVVLTGNTGYFIDTRFIKETGELDWAFAGYRSTEGAITNFKHLIDSRTTNAEGVIDQGENTTLEDGTTVEKGTMVNPSTGKLSSYEEVWDDEERNCCVFITRKDGFNGEHWQGMVGDHQLGLGRSASGVFWAWQARWAEDEGGKKWITKYKTATAGADVTFLPRDLRELHWTSGDEAEFGPNVWKVLEIYQGE